jgi:ParB family chromosome partitioning protein
MTPDDLTELPDGGVEVAEGMTNLQIRQIDPDDIAVDEMNERKDEPLATEELEKSVAENGVVEPPVCRVRDPDAEVPYAVVQGQRRVSAAQAVQLDEIPVLIGEFEDKRALIRSITENIKAGRKDVTTKSRAAAIWELWKLDCAERGNSTREV